MDDSFKEKFLTNEDLQNTIEAYKLDVSKFWYLLLFIYDFIEDIGTNAPTLNKSVLEDFSYFHANLLEATNIILKRIIRKAMLLKERTQLESFKQPCSILSIHIAILYIANKIEKP